MGIVDRLLLPLAGPTVAEQALSYALAIAGPSTESRLTQAVPPPASVVGFGVSVYQARDQLYQEGLLAVTAYIDEMVDRIHAHAPGL